MSEEKVPTKEELLDVIEGEVASEVAEEQEYTEVELEAMEHGWNPEGVEGKENLSAKEFMSRQPIYDDMRKLKKQLAKQREALDGLRKHHEKTKEREYERALRDLRNKKKEALENDDVDQILEIDDQIADVKAEQKLAEKEDKNSPSPLFQEWVDENSWYNQDAEMRQYADMIGVGYAANHPDTQQEDVLDFVSTEVKKRFADKFKPKRSRPSKVEGGEKGARPSKSTKYSARDLPEEDRQIMNTLVRTNVLTEEQYLKDYFGE